MTITAWSSTSLSSSQTTTQTSTQSTSASDRLDAIGTGLQRSGNKIQTQLDTASASLSTLGKFKAAVAQAQSAAKAVADLKDTATADEVKTAMTSLVEKFNAMVSASSAVTTDTSGASRISKALVRTLGADMSKISSLRNLGLSKGSDGRYTLDATKLAAAYQASPTGVRDTLDKLGNLMDKVATKELASDGAIVQTSTALTNKASLLQLQKSALQKALQQYTSFAASSAS